MQKRKNGALGFLYESINSPNFYDLFPAHPLSLFQNEMAVLVLFFCVNP